MTNHNSLAIQRPHAAIARPPYLELRTMRVLVVEDDPMIGRALERALRDEGFAVDWVRSGNDALPAIQDHEFTAVLLDLGLPGRDGLDVLRSVRAGGKSTPVVVITARDGLDDRVEGLDGGADDYMVKPFEIRELLARLRAVVRRRHGQASTILRHGEIVVDLDTHRVEYQGSSHVLGAREFALVCALIERPGVILARTQLEERLYGWGEEVESNAVDVLIHYVRRKFGKDFIRNVRGAGWVIGGRP
jgi:DNA-binding response OmpR family regulator